MMVILVNLCVADAQIESRNQVSLLETCNRLVRQQTLELALFQRAPEFNESKACMDHLVELQSPMRIAESSLSISDFASASSSRISDRKCGWGCWIIDSVDSWYLGSVKTSQDYYELINPYMLPGDVKLIEENFGAIPSVIEARLLGLRDEKDAIKRVTGILEDLVLKIFEAKLISYQIDPSSREVSDLKNQLSESLGSCFKKVKEASNIGVCVDQFKLYVTLKLTPFLLHHYAHSYLKNINAKKMTEVSKIIFDEYNACVVEQILSADNYRFADKKSVSCALSGGALAFNSLLEGTIDNQIVLYKIAIPGFRDDILKEVRQKCTRKDILFPNQRDAKYFKILSSISPNFFAQLLTSCQEKATEIFAVKFSRYAIVHDKLVQSMVPAEELAEFADRLIKEAMSVCLAKLKSQGRIEKVGECELYMKVYGTFSVFPQLIKKEVKGMLSNYGFSVANDQIDKVIESSVEAMNTCKINAIQASSPGSKYASDAAASLILPCINISVLQLAEGLSMLLIDDLLAKNPYLVEQGVKFDLNTKKRYAGQFKNCLEPRIRGISELGQYSASLGQAIGYCQNLVAKDAVVDVISIVLQKNLIEFGFGLSEIEEIRSSYGKEKGNVFQAIHQVPNFDKLMAELNGLEPRLVTGLAPHIISVFLNKYMGEQLSKKQISKYGQSFLVTFLRCYPSRTLAQCVDLVLQQSGPPLIAKVMSTMVTREFEQAISGYLPLITIQTLKLDRAVNHALSSSQGLKVSQAVLKMVRSKVPILEIQNRTEIRAPLAKVLMSEPAINANLINALIDFELSKFKKGLGRNQHLERGVIQNLELRRLYNWRSLAATEPGKQIHLRLLKLIEDLIAGRIRRIPKADEKELADLAMEGFKRLIFSLPKNSNQNVLAEAKPSSRGTTKRKLWAAPGGNR